MLRRHPQKPTYVLAQGKKRKLFPHPARLTDTPNPRAQRWHPRSLAMGDLNREVSPPCITSNK